MDKHFPAPRAALIARRGAVLFVIAALMGCSKPVPDFQITLNAPGEPFFRQYKLTVEGVETPAIAATKPYEFTAHGHPADKPKDMLPHIQASVLYVCGWQKTGIELPPPSAYEVEQARKERRSIPLQMYIDFPPPSWQEVTVVVDNRGGPAMKLAVGANEQEVRANEAGKFMFPYWPHCDQAQQLWVNGESIGRIEADPYTPGAASTMLLDTSASHCYRLESQTYSSSPLDGGPGHGQTNFKPQRLRTLKTPVNYFLYPLPSVEYSSDPVTYRTALNEIACGKVK
jgi:hypothetical protein